MGAVLGRRSAASVALAFGAAALMSGAAAQVQSAGPPALQQPRADSPPPALWDPTVRRCRMLAARRVNPKIEDSVTTEVDRATGLFEIKTVFDAVAYCRAALAAFPAEPKVIIAHYNATEALSTIVLGLKFPDSEEEQLRLVRTKADEQSELSGLEGQMAGFFLGSAYEYGVGTAPDLAAAMKWYAVGAASGDPISKRELARLRMRQR